MNLVLRAAGTAAALALAVTGCSAPTAPAGAGSAAPTGQAGQTGQPGGRLSIEHKQGTTEVPANPQKVVVLDFATLDTLDALDLEDRVAATAQLDLRDTLDEYDDVQRVGTAQEPDIEKIAALGPDLIVISGRTAPKYAELAQVAPTIDLTVDNAKPIESLTTNAETLGQIFGAQDKVTAELSELKKEIDATSAAAPSDARALILLTSGGKVSAFGPGARFGSLIHDVLDVPAADPELEASQHGQAISFEYIAEKNPTHLFVVDRDAAIGQQASPAQQVLDNPLVARTDAWQNKKVTYLDGGTWYVVGFGLQSTSDMVEDVKDALD